MVIRMSQRTLRDRALACASAGLLAAGLLIGSASPASAATTVTISAPTVAVSTAWIQGAVSGSSSGATVRIYKYTSGSWANTGLTGVVNSSRKYAVKVPVPVGSHTFMAKASKSGLATGYSKPAKVYGVTHRGMILYKTNAYRKAYGRPALKGLSSLDKVAQDWTQKMHNDNVLSHNPTYIDEYPGTPQAAAENIASGTGTALTSSNVVGKWMGSPGHRANILGPYTHIGIGFVSGSNGTYATQNFARY
jgi:hypothetical protein